MRLREGWGWLRAHAMASRQGSFRSISPTYAEELDFLSRVEEAERREAELLERFRAAVESPDAA